MPQNATLPVLIVGAGPAGLVAALVLLQNGIQVRIVEKEETIRNVGQRGAGIMPRTFELFKSLGVVNSVQSKAIHVPLMRMYDPESTFAMDEYMAPTPSTPYPNMMLLAQGRSEDILRARLARFGCKVELGTALQGFEQGEDHIEAHFSKRDGDKDSSETVRCRWLIGADGAKGVVRKQLGLSFKGESWPYPLIFGDLEIQGLEEKYWHCWGDMNSTIVNIRPTDEKNVFGLMLGGNINLEKIVDDSEELRKILETATGRTDIELKRVRLISTWRPHSHMVETLRVGRVFVAGDAAHVHTPFGGQGLNTSMHDATNLSWKLSLVEKGCAAPSLLDTYTAERVPVVAEMLKLSSQLFVEFLKAKAVPADREAAWQRGDELRQLDVHYRWSPIVVDERSPKETAPVDPYGRKHLPTDIVRAGERAPDAPDLVVHSAVGGVDTAQQTTEALFNVFGVSHHTVLIFSDGTDKVGRVVSALKAYPAGLLRVVLIRADTSVASLPSDAVYLSVLDHEGYAHEGYQVPKGGFTVIIVRPDGIVGGVVLGADGVKRYFDGVFSALAKVPIRGLL